MIYNRQAGTSNVALLLESIVHKWKSLIRRQINTVLLEV